MSFDRTASSTPARRLTPEEHELESKQRELSALENKLADEELALATLRAELGAFEARYLRIVGARYAELDEIRAQIAEANARLHPEGAQAQKQAEEARTHARQSAESVEDALKAPRPNVFQPSDDLRCLYREVALLVHPDRGDDEEDRARRHKFMVEANLAYEMGDESRLRSILQEWEGSPETVKGDGVGAELVRVIRKIALVQNRLRSIKQEAERLKRSELYELKSRADAAEAAGQDLLAQMASEITKQIDGARSRLNEILAGGR